MTWLIAGLAMAGGLTHRTTREPLPARWVERPLVLPAGWKQLDAQVASGELIVGGRLSLGPLAELRAAGSTDDAVRAPQVGAAIALGRREAPARSASLELGWQLPSGPSGPRNHQVELALPVRRQWGGSRWTVAPVADLTGGSLDARLGLRGEMGLQAGPLGGTVMATGWYQGAPAGGPNAGEPTSWSGAVGGFVQLNRALRVHGGTRVGDDDGGFLGLELSL